MWRGRERAHRKSAVLATAGYLFQGVTSMRQFLAIKALNFHAVVAEHKTERNGSQCNAPVVVSKISIQ